MTDCLFCSIAVGDIPADVVFETDDVVAFNDINPAAPVHVLVIPKRHIASAADLGPEDAGLLAALFEGAAHIGSSIHGGWRIVTNVGPDAGQSVFHLHFHVLGGRRMTWPPG
jgi:histidine triad (HIT) family protein